MSKNETQSTQQSVAKPYPQSTPLINSVLKDATTAYKNGIGGQAYTGSTVVPQSRQTQSALSGIQSTANRNINGANGLNSNLQDIIRQGGFNDQQSGALSDMQRQLKGYGANGLNTAQDDALSNYRSTANGSYDFNANPGSQGVLDSIIGDTRNAVNLNASAAGRYGSGIHEGVLGREIGDVSNQYRSNDYNTWLGRKDAANAGMAALGTTGAQQRQGLASGLFNAGQAGQGNMTAAYAGQQAPYQSLMGVGAANEDLYKRTLDDRLRVWNEQQNAPWKQFGNALNVANLGGNYNNTQTTSTAPGPNPFLQALGGVGTGVSILNGLL